MRNLIKDAAGLISIISFMVFGFYMFASFLVVGNNNEVAKILADRAIYSLFSFAGFGLIYMIMDHKNNC